MLAVLQPGREPLPSLQDRLVFAYLEPRGYLRRSEAQLGEVVAPLVEGRVVRSIASDFPEGAPVVEIQRLLAYFMKEAAKAFLFARRRSSSFRISFLSRKSNSPLRFVMSISGPSVFMVYFMR